MSESKEIEGFCCPACGAKEYDVYDIEPPAFKIFPAVRYSLSGPKSWAEFMTDIGVRSLVNMSMKCASCGLVCVICPYCSFANSYEGNQVQRCTICKKKYYTYV